MRKIVIGASGVALMIGSVCGYLYFTKITTVKFNSVLALKPVHMLHPGDVIESSMLRQVSIPEAAKIPDGVHNVNELVGKKVLVPISEIEEISAWKIGKTDDVAQSGERYYSFKTDTTANVNNMVRKGDKVDVWLEFEQPKIINTSSGSQVIGAAKLIEGLKIASVKSPEGIEVADDTKNLNTIIQSSSEQLRNARSKANGKPETNTYIMTDEIYGAYALGSLGGKIKLALPDVNVANNDVQASITDTFIKLQQANAFTKEKSEVVVQGDLQKDQVKGSTPVDSSKNQVGGGGVTGVYTEAGQTTPKVTEVKK